MAEPIVQLIGTKYSSWKSLKGVLAQIQFWPNGETKKIPKLEIVGVGEDNSRYVGYLTNRIDIQWPLYIKKTTGRIELGYHDFIFGEFEKGFDPSVEIGLLELLKAIISNQIVELKLDSGQVLTCDEIIPINIEPGRSCEALDERIEEIKKSVG